MPLTNHPLPFGLRDVQLKPLSALNVLGAAVDLPVARTFSFTDQEDFETLAGDDHTVGSHGSGPTVAWELESGGLPFEAFKVMAGGTISESGTTPAQKKVFSKLTTDARPYFQAEGQAISDSGGDVHCTVYRCKADGDLDGEFGNGAFFLTGASGTGFGDTVGTTPTNKLYEFTQNETAVAIS
jgi:hypothetical protein